MRYEALEDLPDAPLAAVPSDVNKTGSWRTIRPALRQDACTRCYLCWKFCPDMAIAIDGDGWPVIVLDACKGCGICAEECKPHAIDMVEER